VSLPANDKIEFIVCENVRQETYGKLSLLGFFGAEEIRVDRALPFPAAFPLAFVFVLREGEGNFKVEIELHNPVGDVLFKSDLPNAVKLPERNHTITVNFTPFIVPTPGIYSVVLKLDGHEFTRRLNIRVGSPLEPSPSIN
jgi:hypothetical protein